MLKMLDTLLCGSSRAALLAAAITAGAITTAGCAGRPSLLPNSDPALRKTSTQFAADAAARHPYKADAPRGGEIPSRAAVGYTLNQLDVINLSPEDWDDVEIWVNQKYVVHIPRMQKNKTETIPFQMLYDDKGNYFPTDNSKILVKKVEVYKDGKMFDIPARLGD
jgi:hypothetical protein